MDTVGPISRSVEDAAITIQAIAGYDPKDAYTRNVPVPDYRKALTRDIQGVKMGVILERMDSPTLDSEIREAVAKAISVLGEMGALSEDTSIPLSNLFISLGFASKGRISPSSGRGSNAPLMEKLQLRV